MVRAHYPLLLFLVACAAVPAPRELPTGGAAAVEYAPDHGLVGATTVSFALRSRPSDPQPGGFFGAPWPSELWRKPDGSLDFRGFPGADSFLLADAIAEAVQETDAFSVSPVVYVHFTGSLDPTDLPAPRETRRESSSILLVDVDPDSPDRGALIPVEHRYYADDLRFIPERTLAIKPLSGFVLRPGTLYALVIRRSLTEPPLGTTRDFELTKWTKPHPQPVVEAARRLHAPVLSEVGRMGVDRSDIAALAVFRTQRPYDAFQSMFDAAVEPGPHQPRLLRMDWVDDDDDTQELPYRVARGYYCTPNFQRNIDEVPFLEAGGTIVRDAAGRVSIQPIPADSPYHTPECGPSIRARFVLTVPRGAMPATGWPLLVVAHGSTGDAFAFVGEGSFAGFAARAGVAAVSTDQPLHGGQDEQGARPGSRKPFTFRIGGIPIRLPAEGHGAELAFYHPMRPPVMRDNLRQAAIDTVMLSRLMLGADFSKHPGLAFSTSSPSAADVRFDAERLFLAGHSQGSQSAAVVGVVDPWVRGVVLSGCGGDIRVAFARRQDTNAREVVQLLLRLEHGEIDEFHPVLALVQGVLDPVDPQTWARLYRDPLPGRRPVSVLHFEGLGDTMTLPAMSEALATAMQSQPLRPLLQPIGGLSLLGIEPSPTVRGNAADGQATLALVQLAPEPGQDGHYVMYRDSRASQLVRAFLQALARGERVPGVGPLGPPPRLRPLAGRAPGATGDG